MGFEDPKSGMPSPEEMEKTVKEMEALDRQEALDAEYGNSAEAAETRKQYAAERESNYQSLQEKALAAMAGGPKLSFREREEILREWQSRLPEEEVRELFERLMAS
jgi:hypothetical protein